ncbi:DNA methyltransferase [Singulisphaera rosea]
MRVRAEIWGEDCIAGLATRVPDESVHLTVTSIPFEELFTYSGKVEDVGNNGSTVDIRAGRFALNMRFVASQLFRVTHPGCNVCVHIQQLLAYKNQHGFMGRRDFRGAMIDVFGAGGFLCQGEFAIQKDPQTMAQRLNLHSLQFKTGYGRDSRLLAPAVNDYVLIFHKPGTPSTPVRPLVHTTNPTGWVTTDEWIRDAHGIWTDILEIDVLDGARQAKETDQEKHVCPLQLSLIRRLVRLYSNPVSIQPDVTILDPFMGIGSTAYVCLGGERVHDGPIESPRNVIGFELKESYHRTAVKNVARARTEAKRREKSQSQADMFSPVEA